MAVSNYWRLCEQATMRDTDGRLYKTVGNQLWVLRCVGGYNPIHYWSKVEDPSLQLIPII